VPGNDPGGERQVTFTAMGVAKALVAVEQQRLP
jgi:hypothetical protein